MQISQVMTRGVEMIDPNAMIRDAAIKMRDTNVGALPVGENDRLVGMVTDRDIVVRGLAAGRLPGTTAVREVMSEGIAYCYEDDPIDEAARIMARHKLRRLPVLNRDKRLVGIVGLADLARSDGGIEASKEALAGVTEPMNEPRRFKSR